MARRACLTETEACPLYASGCFEDEHHLMYPRTAYRTPVEKAYRQESFNKVTICRALHQAIHASGYVPEKPTRDLMLDEMWNNRPTERSEHELEVQRQIGQSLLNNVEVV